MRGWLVAAVDAQTLVDAVGLGAVYALMAVGIGLVFGVLRLVNFAYGQLIMAGAYTLAFTSGWPVAGSLLACFAVVIALSLAMERTVFRPLRTQSPAVMLVCEQNHSTAFRRRHRSSRLVPSPTSTFVSSQSVVPTR